MAFSVNLVIFLPFSFIIWNLKMKPVNTFHTSYDNLDLVFAQKVITSLHCANI
jgi:hypothetical protein